MKHLVLAFVLVAAGARFAPAGTGKQVSYAIVIGNNAPPVSGTHEALHPLRYADDDAVRYFELFSRVAESHLLVVLDTQTQKRYPGMAALTQPPTVGNLRRIVDDLVIKMTRDRARGDRPVLYFAFSGHGARDEHGEAFLVLLDGALTQKSLYEDVLGRMPTTFTHLIVDACHAGGVVGVRGGGGFFEHEADTRSTTTTEGDVEPILQATPLTRYPQIGVVLATTVDEETHEWSAIESGVFTHELLSGLLGAADINGDLVIEYSEIQAFVAAANRDIKDPRAIPHVIARPPAANQNVPLLALADIAGMRLVRGDPSALGHFHIELANGQRYLDAHIDTGTSMVLALPDATAAFLRTETREAALPVRGAIALDKLAMARREVEGRGSVEVAYQTALFASGYGRPYYQGYVDSIGAVGVIFPEPAVRMRKPVAQRRTRRRFAIGAVVVGGIAAVTSVTSGILAYEAHTDFESTTLQRAAHDAQARYDRDVPVAIISGGVSIVAAGIAWWVWPRSAIAVGVSEERGGYSVSMGGRW